MNIILFGFKSCGKTTLGHHLSRHLHRPFLDTDHMLEVLYKRRTGQELPFREIFKTLGEPAFRALETDVVQQLAPIHNAVIAVGGGLILNPSHTAVLAKLGALVYLKLNKETLKKRILGGGELPAYFDPADPEGSFEKMYNERHIKYETIPAYTIDLENKEQAQVVLEIASLIDQQEKAHGK